MKKKLTKTILPLILILLLLSSTALAGTYAFYANECPRCGEPAVRSLPTIAPITKSFAPVVGQGRSIWSVML